jgi:hypothetical protein
MKPRPSTGPVLIRMHTPLSLCVSICRLIGRRQAQAECAYAELAVRLADPALAHEPRSDGARLFLHAVLAHASSHWGAAVRVQHVRAYWDGRMAVFAKAHSLAMAHEVQASVAASVPHALVSWNLSHMRARTHTHFLSLSLSHTHTAGDAPCSACQDAVSVSARCGPGGAAGG